MLLFVAVFVGVLSRSLGATAKYHNRCGESLQSFVNIAPPNIPYGQEMDIDDPIDCRSSKTTFVPGVNPGDGGIASFSGSVSKERALGLIITHVASVWNKQKYNCLAEARGLTVWNLASSGAVHQQLKKLKDYICSEFLPVRFGSGSIVDDVRHENPEQPSFTEPQFDIIVSSGVMEHVPDPYLAHQKLHDALKPGGAHVFMTSFAANSANDIIKSYPNGTLGKGFKTLEKSSDKYHPDGWVVYRTFGQEMMQKLCNIGFEVTVHHVQNRQRGILDTHLVFIAWKRKGGRSGARMLRGELKQDELYLE